MPTPVDVCCPIARALGFASSGTCGGVVEGFGFGAASVCDLCGSGARSSGDTGFFKMASQCCHSSSPLKRLAISAARAL